MPELNIITSSDSRLVKHIFTQLKNISENLLPKYKVHFWLFHYRIPKENTSALAVYAEFLGIKFHEIFISDYKEYEYLKKGCSSSFPVECYFYFCAHKYLPENIERALYIDAGDIIFDGDIEEFYFAPFEGNYIITSCGYSPKNELYSAEEFSDPVSAVSIVNGYINSGSMVLNLNSMRKQNISLNFYYKVVDFCIKKVPEYSHSKDGVYYHYFADQGLFAAAFIDKIRFWGYEKYGYKLYFMPYNFRTIELEQNKSKLGIPDGANIEIGYEPHIIHFVGNKPWSTDMAKYDTLLPVSKKYLDMFWEAERSANEDLKRLGIIKEIAETV